MEEKKTDALGNLLEIGATYGYSKRSNGFVRAHVGELVRVNKKRVTLKVIESRKAIYEHNTEKVDDPSNVVQVTANTIFRLDNYEEQ